MHTQTMYSHTHTHTLQKTARFLPEVTFTEHSVFSQLKQSLGTDFR